LPWVSYEALGILLIFVVLAGILILKKFAQLNTDVHGTAEQIEA
jgi:hypothetical protein